MSPPDSDSLATLGETGLLRLLTAGWTGGPGVETGVGDDCAVMRCPGDKRRLLFKTDAVVEGRHFEPATPPRQIGRKALCRALSDIAAMGGEPWTAVVTLGAPADTPPRRLRDIYRGLEAAATRYGVALVGGETTGAPVLWLSIALLGQMPAGVRPVLRATAKAGHLVWVTGKLGATRARHHLTFTPRLEEGAWLARQKLATAMMDLSDGLAADLPRLAEASGVDWQLDEDALPRRRGASVREALTDGEDYELLFTTQPGRAESLRKTWPFRTPIRCIGRLCPRGSSARPAAHGYDHFRQ